MIVATTNVRPKYNLKCFFTFSERNVCVMLTYVNWWLVAKILLPVGLMS